MTKDERFNVTVFKYHFYRNPDAGYLCGYTAGCPSSHQVSAVQQFCGYRRSYQKGGHGCQCRDFDAGGFTDSCESSGFYT